MQVSEPRPYLSLAPSDRELLDSNLADFRRHIATRRAKVSRVQAKPEMIILQPTSTGDLEFHEAPEPSRQRESLTPKRRKPAQSRRPSKPTVARDSSRSVSLDDMVAWIRANQPCTAPMIAKGLQLKPNTVRNRISQLEGRKIVMSSRGKLDEHIHLSKFYTILDSVSVPCE